MSEKQTVTVKARMCPYDPRDLLGYPIGMHHCKICGCMVVAGIEQGICLPNLCPLLEADGSGDHPGEPFDYELEIEAARHLGLAGEETE